MWGTRFMPAPLTPTAGLSGAPAFFDPTQAELGWATRGLVLGARGLHEFDAGFSDYREDVEEVGDAEEVLELLAELHEFEAAAGGFGGGVEADEGAEPHAVRMLYVGELDDDALAVGDEFADGGVEDVGGSGDEAAVADDEDDSVGVVLDLGSQRGWGGGGVRHGCAPEGLETARRGDGCHYVTRGVGAARCYVWGMAKLTLQEEFGQIDIYLFDQLLKGRIAPGMSVLDAGCGGGRNLVYLLREGYEVLAADADAGAVEAVREMARRLRPDSLSGLPEENFRVEPVEAMSFEDACADVVICNTVLHFARDDAHFEQMLTGVWRKLKPGGLFFARLGSVIGMESHVEWLGGRRYRSPDGSERYLVDEAQLMEWTGRLGELADPLKTTLVQGLRAMTTWVVRKG